MEPRKEQRGHRLYLDIMRNAYAQTVVAHGIRKVPSTFQGDFQASSYNDCIKFRRSARLGKSCNRGPEFDERFAFASRLREKIRIGLEAPFLAENDDRGSAKQEIALFLASKEFLARQPVAIHLKTRALPGLNDPAHAKSSHFDVGQLAEVSGIE